MNQNGQLGDGTLTNSYSPKNITISGLLSNEKIVSVFATFGDSFALSNLGRVYAWGWNAGGTLGIGNTTVNRTTPQRLSFTGLQTGEFIQKISNGSSHSLALSNLGKLYVWGNNDYGQLGDGGSGPTSIKSSPTVLSMTNYLSNETIVEISCGESTSFVITSTGKILVWGTNQSGELGLGDQNTRLTPTLMTITL
jgi:alpha-tubulin suppressor-like RCC1 family protein